MSPKAKAKAKAKAEGAPAPPRRRRDQTSIDDIVKGLSEAQQAARAHLRELRAERRKQVQRQQRLNKKARGLEWQDLIVLAELKGVSALENVSRECSSAAVAASARIAAAQAASASGSEAAALPPPEAPAALPAPPPHQSGGSDSE